MNWLQDNPVGRALVYTSGSLLLLAVIITIAWSLPVNVDENAVAVDDGSGVASVAAAREIASLNELQVINQRPVFNENRLPPANDVQGGEEELLPPDIEVQGAPDVKLTGVIITPDVKIATLTPAGGIVESVMAREGELLIGEYVGWSVAEVKPRTVLLRSSDGQQMQLELQVHDAAIKEPPKPVAAAPGQDPASLAAAEKAADQAPVAAGEDAEPVSRAEQIRQRIAERREQLRQEQEAREAQVSKERAPASSRTNYQNAIREMMKRGNKDSESEEDSNG